MSQGIIIVMCFAGAGVSAQERISENQAAIQARGAWMNRIPSQALEILKLSSRNYPENFSLHKLRGDILTTIDRLQEALEAYEAALKNDPQSMDAQWAKWSVFTQLGEQDLAIDALRRMIPITEHNPLLHFRLARDLRKLDRLEDSLESYREAVKLSPEMFGWRLALARAFLDVLEYENARMEVEHVLQKVPKDSPIGTAARNLLLVVYGATKETGRRFQPILNPEGTGADLKRWGLARHNAWTLYTAGRYREAEPVLREILALRPSDQQAAYELGMTLMELDQYQEAIKFFQKGIDLGLANEVYLDAIYRIGRCLVELERWPEAFIHFALLQELAFGQKAGHPDKSAGEMQKSTDEDEEVGVPGAPILDKERVGFWLETVRKHLSAEEKSAVGLPSSIPAPINHDSSPVQLEGTATRNVDVFEPIDSRASLMGRDADFSWFRFVIPAKLAMRNDSLMGSHEFIPIDPHDTFSAKQTHIDLVFGLVTPSYDEIPLTAKCFLESSEILSGQEALAQDRVMMTMNEQYGYFRIQTSKGWDRGLYRCGLYVGDEISAYKHVDEVRFQSFRNTSCLDHHCTFST